MSDIHKQGAEARLYTKLFLGKKCLVKERFKKMYRHAELERSLTTRRMKNEVRAIIKCRQCGIHTPALYYVDNSTNAIYMEYMHQCITLKDHINSLLHNDDSVSITKVANLIGQMVARLHDNNVIHGDLTSSNMLVRGAGTEDVQLVLIDFGLTSLESSNSAEDKGVDLYVLERALISTHPNTEYMFQMILDSYKDASTDKSGEVLAKLEEVRLRGRKRTMVG